MAALEIGWLNVVEALVVSLAIVVFDKAFDLSFEIAAQIVVFQ